LEVFAAIGSYFSTLKKSSRNLFASVLSKLRPTPLYCNARFSKESMAKTYIPTVLSGKFPLSGKFSRS
jgi:hypothetical protein